MSMDDPVEMMRVLQQKMDEMQQRHEEEMAAVKADCEARIAREVGRIDGGERVKDKGKGVEGDRPPAETECDKTWRPSGSEAEGSKAKSVHAESAAEDGRMVVKDQKPFSDSANEEPSALPNSRLMKECSNENNSQLGWATKRRIVRPTKLQADERVFQREQLSACLVGRRSEESSALPNSRLRKECSNENNSQLGWATKRRIVRPTKLQADERVFQRELSAWLDDEKYRPPRQRKKNPNPAGPLLKLDKNKAA
ncbi:uncharacterized protein HKW66_Vig0081150 [Vigna angularis]|uniref:Uncharacterized protein n=1 Tax=Phaseolus angularis TaxID=3914 RepID=A0A8T0KM15_PHAAN|nr:uncharacterized protein HKW66_Vig0081150 [Vigna angularis]